LILFNSGAGIMMEVIVAYLTVGDPGDLGSNITKRAVDAVANVLHNYVRTADPMYGPLPMKGGLEKHRDSALSSASIQFMIAHEYAHILAGHFFGPNVEEAHLDTNIGSIDVLKKNHDQELEADDIAYRLILGVEDYDQFDFRAIDLALESHDWEVMDVGLTQKCRIAAPFVPLTIDFLLENVNTFQKDARAQSEWHGSHPSSLVRCLKLLDVWQGKETKYTGFISYPGMLLPWKDRIVEAVRAK
jgi:hypothetical protein